MCLTCTSPSCRPTAASAWPARRYPHRSDHRERRGARQAQHPYGVDIVVEAVGTLPTIWQSMDLVTRGGIVNIVGEYWGKVELGAPRARG